MTNKYREYWSWENRHLRLDITRTGINGKMFYLMQPDELIESIEILNKQINSYKPSISGTDITAQKHHAECIAARQNAQYSLDLIQRAHKV